MATIQFKALGKKDPVNLNVRFFHNTINCYAKSNIFIENSDWNKKTNKLRANIAESVKLEVGDKIEKMSKHIFQSFKRDFPIGEQIDSSWLIKEVDAFYSKPNDLQDFKYYFTPFVEKYINESKTRLNPKTGKVISDKTIKNFNTTLTRIKEYEIREGKLKTKDVNLNFHKKFTSFLKIDGQYSNTVIEKYIGHVKQFVKEAKVEGFETNPEVESSRFTFQRDETIDTYLNESEIDLIFNLNLENNERLDNVRDLFVIGLWTGLRISDLKRIHDFNVSENRIKITDTTKTVAFVEIPIHPQIRQILEKRNGSFPPVISEQKFNQYIKEVCQMAGIDGTTLGYIKDPKTNRKVKGYYPKYSLISSHTCRRSFVSNHYGNLDDKTIMAITTHKSYAQYLRYVKTTLKEHAAKFEQYWQEKEEMKSAETMLKVVS